MGGNTRKTWSFNNLAKDRVQVALTSEGRPVNADIQLWLGPDWTPFSLKAYSEDEFPFNAASNYAKGAMALLPQEIPATSTAVRVDGGALRSFPLDPECEQLEVVLNTDGKQLNARIELLNAP